MSHVYNFCQLNFNSKPVTLFHTQIHLRKNSCLTCYNGLDARKPVFRFFEQQRCSPACASTQSDYFFAFLVLESFISRLATNEISILLLVSIAEEAGLSLALSEAQRQVLLRRGPIM